MYCASQKGELAQLLNTLRERLAQCDKDGWSLLHFACTGPNVAAIVA